MRELPSGRQYTIVHGTDRATVVEVGGGLRSYVADGRELLDGYAEDEMATSARGQPLIPGTEVLPYASGQHPYLAAPTGLVDECTLQAPGASYLPTDERGIPTGREPVRGSEYDFRDGRQLRSVELDLAFSDLDRDGDGRAWVRLRAPDGQGAAVWLDENYPYVELFTGDTVPDPKRRRRGLGAEPMTAPPNAFQSSTDVARLEPGASSSASWGLRALP